MSFNHTHDGVPCPNQTCALDRDRPARVTGLDKLAMAAHQDVLNDIVAQMSGPGSVQHVKSDAAQYAGDRVIPLRIVENTVSGSLVVRCIALLANGHGCPEEWHIGPHGDERGAQVWADALGHVATKHRS